VWLIGAMVCLLAAPWVQLSASAGNRWPHNGLRHHWLMPISCHLRVCKALRVTSLTHVSGTITSVQTFTFMVCEYVLVLYIDDFIFICANFLFYFLHNKLWMHGYGPGTPSSALNFVKNRSEGFVLYGKIFTKNSKFSRC